MTSQAKYRWNKELWENRDLLKRKKREIPLAKKKKQESEDDRGKQSLQLWSLRGLAALCSLLLDVNQSACDVHPIKPVHVLFSPLQLETQAKTNMSKQVTKQDKKIRNNGKNAHI